MTTKVLRPTKEGGLSYCSVQDDENVGKRRCNHIPGSIKFNVEVNQISRGLKEVVISEDYEQLDDEDRIEVIKKFTNTLKPVSQKKLDQVLSILETMK